MLSKVKKRVIDPKTDLNRICLHISLPNIFLKTQENGLEYV
jgi:hypothetical protein